MGELVPLVDQIEENLQAEWSLLCTAHNRPTLVAARARDGGLSRIRPIHAA